jgi:hypothetical protein
VVGEDLVEGRTGEVGSADALVDPVAEAVDDAGTARS